MSGYSGPINAAVSSCLIIQLASHQITHQNSLTTLSVVGQESPGKIPRSRKVSSTDEQRKERKWITLGCTRLFSNLLLSRPDFFGASCNEVASRPRQWTCEGNRVPGVGLAPLFFNDCFLAESKNVPYFTTQLLWAAMTILRTVLNHSDGAVYGRMRAAEKGLCWDLILSACQAQLRSPSRVA